MDGQRGDLPGDVTHDRESAGDADDALELKVWLRLLTCTMMIEHRVRAGLSEQFATTLPRFDALAQLHRAPDGLTMGALSQRMMVSNGNVTGLIDRLAEEGHVERLSMPGDRRAQIVRLTEEGREQFAAMAPAHRRWVKSLFRSLSREELRTLFALLGRMKASVGAETASPTKSPRSRKARHVQA